MCPTKSTFNPAASDPLRRAAASFNDPVSLTDAITTPEDTPYDGQVVYESDGQDLTYEEEEGTSHGDVTINADGTYRYVPDLNYHGPDQFVAVVSDGKGGSALITVSITVTPVNDPPTARPDFAEVDEDSAGNIIVVLNNDNDLDGDMVSVVSAVAMNGATGINPDGTLGYTPVAGFYGQDIINYTIEDPDGLSDATTVTVTVYAKPVNTLPPVELDEEGLPIPQKVFQNSVLTFASTNAVPNAISVADPDSTHLTVMLSVTNGLLAASQTTGLEFVDDVSSGTNTLVMSGLIADLNAALEGLAYAPRPNYFGPDFLSILTIDEGGRLDADNAGVAILVEIQALGGIPNVDLTETVSREGVMVTNVTLVSVEDPELIQTVSLNSTNLVVEILPTAGQDGATNRTTVNIEVTYDDGTTLLVPVPVIIYQPLLTSVTDSFYDATFGVPTLNPQTSLYEQKVRVVNQTPFDFTALRLTVTNLASTVRLRNAAGTNALGPYVEYNLAVTAGSEQSLTLEYFSENLAPFVPALKLELLNQASGSSEPSYSRVLEISGFRGYNPAAGRVKFYVEFATEAGRKYVIQYADGLGGGEPQWETSPITITGTGQRLHWMDDGPPNTETPPGTMRVYRVLVTD